MSETTKIKTETNELIENLKKLPPDKQIYVSGYVQGIADSMADKETKESA